MRFRWIALVAGFVLLAGSVGQAEAAPKKMRAQPWEYVGAAGGCGTGSPVGQDTVDAYWVPGEGNRLADGDGGSHALYLAKSGPSENCASAGASITNVEGITLTEIGFDYRSDGHCGAGAPRFNVQTDVTFAFLGCAGGTHTDLGNGWTRVTFAPPPGEVEYIEIVFDEGTDVGEGFVYLDNININGTFIGGPGNA